jgi:hypothetical protein
MCFASTLPHHTPTHTSTHTENSTDFTALWEAAYYDSLNFAKFSPAGPQWALKNIVLAPSTDKRQKDAQQQQQQQQSAWVFSVNHGADDQRSVNIMVNELVADCKKLSAAAASSKKDEEIEDDFPAFAFPDSIETAVAPGLPSAKTFLWAVYQVFNMLLGPVMVPRRVSSSKDAAARAATADPDSRRTFCRFLSSCLKAV